ncbi:MAG: DUF305 domain-containing protein [Glaciimonas sp.]|nr:DUF305 domain-containing protein [Glaciimonas sp.]
MHTRNNKNGGRRIAHKLVCALVVAISTYAVQLSAAAQPAPAAAGKSEMHANVSNDATMKMSKSMDDMQKNMRQIKMSGDLDHDFAMMMRVHHQGAIDMAQAEVDAGKDPTMIMTAKKIIAAQKKEIAQFDDWLKKHSMK